jgi:hypothetical protein
MQQNVTVLTFQQDMTEAQNITFLHQRKHLSFAQKNTLMLYWNK